MAKMFEPLAIGSKVAKNRVVFPPGVRFDTNVVDGVMNDATIEHYKKVAQAGCGVIIVEATCIDKEGRITPTQLGIWDDSFIDGLAKIPPIAHAEGAIALIQIQHSGVKTSKEVTADIVAPSDYTFQESTARALSLEEIEKISQQFIDACLRAKKAGFDGVELHGCHGYLMNQFLSPTVNSRDDIYGEDKAKFVTDIITRLRKEVGDDFIIGVRMPGNDPDVATCATYAQRFEQAGADFVHVSAGFIPKPPADLNYEQNDNYNWIVATGLEIKKHVGIPVIVVNSIKTPEHASYILETGNADFIAILRAYLCDFNWIDKAKAGPPVVQCLSCKPCLKYTGIDKCVLKND